MAGFLAVFEEAWEEVCDGAEVVYKEGESFDSLLAYEKEMLRVFARSVMPMKVIAVEVPFEFKLEHPETGEEFPVPIKGVIDLIEEAVSVGGGMSGVVSRIWGCFKRNPSPVQYTMQSNGP